MKKTISLSDLDKIRTRVKQLDRELEEISQKVDQYSYLYDELSALWLEKALELKEERRKLEQTEMERSS